jgi:hypothetical protein
MLPDFERTGGEFWSYPEKPRLVDSPIDGEEDGTFRAVVAGC